MDVDQEDGAVISLWMNSIIEKLKEMSDDKINVRLDYLDYSHLFNSSDVGPNRHSPIDIILKVCLTLLFNPYRLLLCQLCFDNQPTACYYY